MKIRFERDWEGTSVVVTTADGAAHRAYLENIVLNTLLALATLGLLAVLAGFLYAVATMLPRVAQLGLLGIVGLAVGGGAWCAFKEEGEE